MHSFAWLVLVMASFLFGCIAEDSNPTLKQCEVWIDAPLTKVRGTEWARNSRPSDPLGPLSDVHGIDDPCEMTIHFPSGKQWSTYAKAAILSQKGGSICEIDAFPFKRAVDFRSAVLALDEIASDLGVEKQKRLRDKVDAWKNEKPPEDLAQTRSLVCDVEEGIKLFAEIKAVSDGGGWYLNINFSASRFFPD